MSRRLIESSGPALFWRTTIVTCVGYLLSLTGQSIMPFCIDYWISTGVLMEPEAAMLSGVEYISVGAAIAACLPLMKRITQRHLGMLACGLVLVGNVISIESSHFATILAGRGIAGFAAGILTALVQVMAATSGNPKERYVLMNLSALAFGAGLIASSAPLVTRFGARGPLALNASLALVCICVMAMGPATTPAPATTTQALPPRTEHLQRNWIGGLAALGVMFAFAIAMNGVFAFSVVFGTRAGLSVSGVGTVMIIGVAASFAGGLLISKLSVGSVVVPAAALMAAATLGIGYAHSPAFFALALCSLMFTAGLVIPVLYVFGAEADPDGSVAAIAPIALMVGGAVGSFIIGNVIKNQSSYALFGVPYAFVLLGSALAYLIHRRQFRR